MAMAANNPSDDKLSALWHEACTDYAKQTGTPLVEGGFSELRGPGDLSRLLENEKDHFQDFRMKRRPLLHAMQTVIAPFETWGALIALTSFPPASTIMGAMLLLVRGVRKVSEAFDMITAMFRKLGNFALRLDSYKGVPLSEGMKVIIVKVLVNFLRVCAASQKLVSRGSFKARLTQWAKSTFLEDGEVGQLFGELEELTSQEHMMVSAHNLNLTHQALRNTEELLERDNRRNDRERLQRVKAALNPVSASSQVFSSINENRIPGSGAWLEAKLRSWWEGPEPILWLHGGPGVGKSFIASKIITELLKEGFSAAPAPVVASFFCRNNDVDLRSINNGLRTLAWQIATQREDFAAHVEETCLKEDPANTYVVWRKLLVNYFTEVPSQGTCLVIDGLDEADPEEQEILCSLLEKTFSEDDMGRPPLRVVLLSRDSLRGLLDEHSLAWIDEVEIGNDQNKDDLHGYVAQKLQKTKLFRGSPEFQQEIVKEISREAEGLWEWANLVIKSVLRCRTKEQIRKGIKTMPRGISAMLTQELQRLGRELSDGEDADPGEEGGATQIDQLNIILSFVALAQKPLTVLHLQLILELLLKEEVLNLEEDLRTVYASLFLLRPDTDEDRYNYETADIVVLRHSSFYEFFRSAEQSGPVGVDVDQTEVNFVYILLCNLAGRCMPCTDQFIGCLGSYGKAFLPSHFTRARPEKAGKLREDISALIHELFSRESCRDWYLSEFYWGSVMDYCTYPMAFLEKVVEFWLDSADPNVINERAEMTLQWLLPETRQGFEDNARQSAVANDGCSFTILFSYIVTYLRQEWLEPSDIKPSDGLPAAVAPLLIFYSDVTAVCTGRREDIRVNGIVGVNARSLDSSEILAAAELHAHERNALWHARVAQALLLNDWNRDALVQFQLALEENQKTLALEAPSLSVIHRDMSRAYSAIGRHTEALEHHELSESLVKDIKQNNYVLNNQADQLLNLARLKHRAKRTGEAVETANEAWRLATIEDEDDENWYPDFSSFFGIFLELHQPQHLRRVMELAFEFYETRSSNRTEYKDFAGFIVRSLEHAGRKIYRVLQYALTVDDHAHLDRLSSALQAADTWSVAPDRIPLVRCLLATVLFTKGRVSLGVDQWCLVAGLVDDDDNDEYWHDRVPKAWSTTHLVSLCLEQPDIPPSERCPLALDSDDQTSEACLVLSKWLRNHGDMKNAREVLRWRVKHCLALLSDDDPWNDDKAYRSLFTTFVADPDSQEDREAVLHLVKVSDQQRLAKYDKVTRPGGTVQNAPEKVVAGSPMNIDVPTENNNDDDDDDDFDPEQLGLWGYADDLSECANCWTGIAIIHFWYFCRSCPQTALCRRCYRELQSADGPSGPLSLCVAEHEFCHTGGFLRPSEMVDEGKVSVVSAEGEREVIWIEEWKDRLAEKWKTDEFELKGGLSAWCLRVLPEPQRTRWAAFFQT
ncbi:hypothetical protein BJY00DRAFT_285504 [Aspergillus carlsbadensis]|nr:hypothetical protein BJY00DRAFT_285504 [Aspergillus carlsbadensis]